MIAMISFFTAWVVLLKVSDKGTHITPTKVAEAATSTPDYLELISETKPDPLSTEKNRILIYRNKNINDIIYYGEVLNSNGLSVSITIK
jgi:hypothetical protein